MGVEFEYIEKEAYLAATISDTTIDLQQAESILESIDAECRRINCQKVLLNELIDTKARLLSAFTFTEEYRAKHFSEQAKAIQWLNSPRRQLEHF